jgi:hypothetical protein
LAFNRGLKLALLGRVQSPDHRFVIVVPSSDCRQMSQEHAARLHGVVACLRGEVFSMMRRLGR